MADMIKSAWESFLDGLASDGGDVFVLLILIVIVILTGYPQYLEMLIGALLGLVRGSMKGKQ